MRSHKSLGKTPVEQELYDELTTRDKFGKTRFETACILGQVCSVKRTCEALNAFPFETKLAMINKRSEKGYTALHHAAAWGKVEVVKILLEHGADCNAQTIYRDTPKRMAEKYMKSGCVQVLAVAEVRRNIMDNVISMRESIHNPKKSKVMKFRSHALSELNLALEQIPLINDVEELLGFEKDLTERICLPITDAM